MDFFAVLDTFDREGNLNSDTNRVNYDFSGTGGGSLSRTCQKGAQALLQESGSKEELSSDISELVFKYAKPGQEPDKPFQWQNSWAKQSDPQDAEKNSLPMAVKIELTLKNKDKGKEISFTKVIPLPIVSKVILSPGTPNAQNG